MDKVMVDFWKDFLSEFKKDLLFFSLSGGLVGALMLIHSCFEKSGVVLNGSWSNELFSDFIPFNAFGLIFFGIFSFGVYNSMSVSGWNPG